MLSQIAYHRCFTRRESPCVCVEIREEKPDTAGSPADWDGRTLSRRKTSTEEKQPDEIPGDASNAQLPEGIAPQAREPWHPEVADALEDAWCYDGTVETGETLPKDERNTHVETDTNVGNRGNAGNAWLRSAGGRGGHRQWGYVAIGLGYLMAAGAGGVAVNGCLAANRVERVKESLCDAAEEVREDSKEVINVLGDRLEGVVEKIPTKFEIAPTEVQVMIKSSNDGLSWILGVFAFVAGIPFGVLGLKTYEAFKEGTSESF